MVKFQLFVSIEQITQKNPNQNKTQPQQKKDRVELMLGSTVIQHIQLIFYDSNISDYITAYLSYVCMYLNS